ncbi:purple acid phosphatase family protein [Raineyella fluvialis]|uniref:3',5'-cyclic AMP phosphodiesterase CpdA n=1 Tax=Raineyella fluvialis TaxID=2662261 RepID=A0A5Q2FCB4_9ACTN|nr:metallophosphoesterase family protein [Raineyella fluvialis]QGF24710.1 hypothetical protein Rai3103_14920 [Raineyella fluvialis]
MNSSSSQEAVRPVPNETDGALFRASLGRRGFLAAAGLVGAAVSAPFGAAAAFAAPSSGPASDLAGLDPVTTPPVEGLHTQFGLDASSQMTVSWHTMQPVSNARVLVGTENSGYHGSVAAATRSYRDAKSGKTVYAHHARVGALKDAQEYVYLAVHDGATAQSGTFRTAPRGRQAFRFTSFGDQATPTIGKRYTPPAGVTLPNPPYVNDNLGSPFAADTVAGVERAEPLFHLFNGDLCYANLAQDRVRTWWDFWNNNTRSARNRPWMPSAGNHENEKGNGFGFLAYQTYFDLPPVADQAEEFRGLWYAFTAGSVRVISINNDDVCYQDGGDSYVRGYSHGAQKAWLEAELKATRANNEIDWIVVTMHQVVISTADKFNGADLGIRQEFVPLFDEYGVDLVVCGHEHHYERSHPLRGAQQNQTLTPVPAGTDTHVVDTSKGTVHMVIGSGGTGVPSNQLFFTPPACRVITSVGAPGANGKRPPVYVQEDAPWSAVRDAENAYGFAAFDVDPGQPGGTTSIRVTYYAVTGVGGECKVSDTFTLQRPRRDAEQGKGQGKN